MQRSGPSIPPASALLLAPDGASLRRAADGTGPGLRTGAARESRISSGTFLVHADLHNHTLLSDGAGDPADAFASMRAAGVDVAALTDHASLPSGLVSTLDADRLHPRQHSAYLGAPSSLTAQGWRLTGELADAHDEPGAFTAMRGFEWTEPWFGHVNVWLSEDYVDVRDASGMEPFLRWLRGAAGPLDGQRFDALAGFNHPGREPGRFAEFTFDSALRERMVSFELFNRGEDYLFEGYDDGLASPLVACLRAGWQPGVIGVSDEHRPVWGHPEGKGRAGLWVRENTRRGVHEALLARRFFATRLSGLRLDATANGVRMGGTLRHRRGAVEIALDVDRGTSWTGRPLEAQVLRPGDLVPVAAAVEAVAAGEPHRFSVPVDVDDGEWLVLRIADPEGRNGSPGPVGHPANSLAVAYASPWYLQP